MPKRRLLKCRREKPAEQPQWSETKSHGGEAGNRVTDSGYIYSVRWNLIALNPDVAGCRFARESQYCYFNAPEIPGYISVEHV